MDIFWNYTKMGEGWDLGLIPKYATDNRNIGFIPRNNHMMILWFLDTCG